MTRDEAAEKVAKLLRLAQDRANPHEADSARRRAEKIIAEHGLTPDDMAAGNRAAAFDELVSELEGYVSRHPVVGGGLFDQVSVVRDVLARLRGLARVEKSRRLGQVEVAVHVAVVVAGDSPVVRDVRDALARVKSKYDVK